MSVLSPPLPRRVRSESRRLPGYLVLFLFLLFVVGPIIWLLGLSLKTRVQAFADPPLLIFLPTIRNYVNLISEGRFLRFFSNSLLVASAATVVSIAIGAPAAFGLVRLENRLSHGLLIWVLLARMAPTMTYVIPFFAVYSRFGLIDTRHGLIIAYLTLNLPVVIWLMRSFFLDVPRSLEESAIIDGASLGQTFFRVVLPVSAPGLVSAAIITFVLSWNEFIFALVLTRRRAVTAPIAIVNLMRYEGTEWGQMAAGGMLLIIPAVLIAFFVGRYITQGLTRGAVKE